MKKEKKLIIDTLLYGISSFGSKILSFILLPIYSGYFTVIEFGKWDLIATTVSLLSPLISLEITSALYRWLLESKKDEDRISVITSTFIFFMKGILVFTCLYFFIAYFYKIEYGKLLYIMIILSQLEGYTLKCLRGLSKNKNFVIIGIIKSVISFSIAIMLIYIFKLKLEVFMYASIFSSLIGVILGIYYIQLWKYIDFSKQSKKLSKEMRKYSLPLIPGATNWWIMNVSDRYLVRYFLGGIITGTYAMANKFPSLLNLINSIFFMAWQDNALKEYGQEGKDFYYSKIFKYYSRIMYFSVTILVLINRIVLTLILSSEYSNVWKYSNLLYIAALFSFFSSFWGIGYHGNKNTKIILNTTLVGAIVNILINLILINQIGLYAATVSTIVSYLIMWIYRIKSAKDFKINIEKKEFTKMNVLLLIILGLSFLENLKIEIIGLVIIILIYINMNKNELNNLKDILIRHLKRRGLVYDRNKK